MKIKEMYFGAVEEYKFISEGNDKVVFFSSVLRSLVQCAAVFSIEVVHRFVSEDELPERMDSFKERIKNPSDGLPLEIIDCLVPVARKLNPGFFYGWFEAVPEYERSLCQEILDWVEFRNSRQSHGVIDVDINREWLSKTENIFRQCMLVFRDFLDCIPDDEGRVVCEVAGESLQISTPLSYDSQPFVIRKIFERKGVWNLRLQVLSARSSVEHVVYVESGNPVVVRESYGLNDKFKLSEVFSGNAELTFFNNIPVRQTTIFEGREDEIGKLKEWLEDLDSRACLVYGDGGVGKTTLALEFFNRWIDGEIEIESPIPEVVSFYSAKMTRWESGRVVHLKGIPDALEQCLRELMYCFEKTLDKSWFTVEGSRLVDKVKEELVKNNFKRNDVVLIIDNTETFVKSVDDVEHFSSFLKTVSKKIGRILLTSRRRELLGADPISVENLTELESLNLIKRLAVEHNAAPLLQAGEARLRRVSRKLSCKPLLIDSLVKYISRSSASIDEALDSIYARGNDELLEFLYEDAWVRMNEAQQIVFLILVNISCPVDSFSVSRACQLTEIQHAEFQKSLDETYFSNVTDYGSFYDVEIVEMAGRFFLNKMSFLSELERKNILRMAAEVDRKALEKERVEKEYKSDRVAEAFRSQFAKAAKIESDKGNLKEAKDFYKLAIKDDPINAALHDRYAWFLLHKTKEIDEAMIHSKRSVELSPVNSDAMVTRALLHYRLNDLKEGDKWMQLASERGKPKSLCFLRMAIARYHSSLKEVVVDKRMKLLSDANVYLGKARSSFRLGEEYYHKNKSDMVKYEFLVRKERLRSLS